jgi:Bacteriophage Mu, Gp36
VLASLDDVNTHLPQDKLHIADADEQVAKHQVDVDRVIKGYLSSTYTPATLALWVDPDDTPDFIRSIAGRLVAAWHYARMYSEDVANWDRTYPQRLYNEAMAMLEEVRSGAVDLGIDEEAATAFGSNFFYPTKDTEPVFTMGMRF